jgi:hypothetical protein
MYTATWTQYLTQLRKAEEQMEAVVEEAIAEMEEQGYVLTDQFEDTLIFEKEK